MRLRVRRTSTTAAALLGAVLLVACLPIEPEATAGAPGSAAGPCITDEPRLLHYARWLATDPDPRVETLRRRYDLESAPESEVEQVTDPTVCLRAGSAHRNALDLGQAATAVAVIRVGERYIVTSRVGGSTSREFGAAVVLDDSFRVLARYRR